MVAECASKTRPLAVPLGPEVVGALMTDGEGPEAVDHCHEVEDVESALELQEGYGPVSAILTHVRRSATKVQSNVVS